MLERMFAKVVFPIELELNEKVQPNRRPIKAVLFRANVRSIAAPFGSDKPVVIDKQALKKMDLSSLIGLPLHATPNLDGHWIETEGGRMYFPVGTITFASFIDDCVIGFGYLWDLDYPEIVESIREAARSGELAVSWEISDVVLDDEGDYYRILAFKPTGWALLRAENAAYKSLMPAIAAIANKEIYDPTTQDLKVLLDDHRLMHAYYATIRRGGEIFNWTLGEVVKMHAAIADEMLRRHIQHKRGEGLSRKLNEESLSLQTIPVFTDEVRRNVQQVLEVDKDIVAKLFESYEHHEKVTIDELDLDVSAIPLGVPIAVAIDKSVFAIVVFSKDRKFVAVIDVFKRPLPRKKFEGNADTKRKLQIASCVIDRLPELVVVPAYIAVTGSSLLTEAAKDLDLLILDNGKLMRLITAFQSDRPVHFTITDKPAGLSFPVYDLMLVKRVRPSIEPAWEEPQLVEHITISTRDIKSIVSARLRSLGDLEIYQPLAFVAAMPEKRGILRITDETATVETDEGEIFDVSNMLRDKPESCLEAVCEVWFDGNSFPFAVADCLWWNATKVSELPFLWRLAFVAKIADGFVLPKVDWVQISDPESITLNDFVLQDSNAPYGVPRLIIRNAKDNGGASDGRGNQ